MGIFNFVSGAIGRVVDKAIDTRMLEAGKAAVEVAHRLVPKRTGYLDTTIGFTYDQARKLLILHADAPYSAVVEEGSIYMRARPYLRPALNEIGRMWGGNTQISYPNAYHLSGKTGPVKVARFNELLSKRLHRGASGRAKVRYQHGGLSRRSRDLFSNPLFLMEPFDHSPII